MFMYLLHFTLNANNIWIGNLKIRILYIKFGMNDFNFRQYIILHGNGII